MAQPGPASFDPEPFAIDTSLVSMPFYYSPTTPRAATRRLDIKPECYKIRADAGSRD